jgi:hypothetical protein
MNAHFRAARVSKRVFGLILLAGAMAQCFAQPEGTGMIAGVVLQKANGEPVRKAIVTLTWFGNPRSWATAITDGAGRYKFENLPAGKYSIQASKEGAGNATYGGESMRQMFEYITLADGQKRTDIVLRMIRPAYVSGTVLDDQGDPIINAEVILWNEGYPRGVRELVHREATRSNDRGEFRLSINDTGRFYISAGDFSGFRHQGNLPQDTYARQFYGGVTDWHRATPVTIGPGDQIRGIDIRLTPVRAFTLRGKVVGIPTPPQPPAPPEEGVQVSAPTTFVNVQLGLLSESGQVLNNYGAGAGPPHYTFQFPNLLPGKYRLSANSNVNAIPGQMEAPAKSYWGIQRLDLTSDPGEITVALAPPTDLKGQVRTEGGGFEKSEFTVRLTSPDVPWQPVSAKTDPQGRFTLEQVPPGIWDINVEPIPPGGFIKSMRLGKQDVLTEDMEIGTATETPLNIVVSSRGGRVNGEISDPSFAGRRSVLVLLAPVGKFSRVMSFFAIVQSDQQGKFKMRGLTPGKYKLLAFEEAPPDDPRNPELAARLEGQPVEVVEGEAIEAKVDVITSAQLREALK